MEKKQTAVTLLFLEFKTLSKAMRNAGDTNSSNLIDFLCEREEMALKLEREQIEEAWGAGSFDGGVLGASEYYEETFKP